MPSRQNADIRRMWAERKAFVKINNEYRKEIGDEPLARAEVDSFSDAIDDSHDYTHGDTLNFSETCRNYLRLRDSILKDTQILQQQESTRKRERSRDLSILLPRDRCMRDLVPENPDHLRL